MKNAKYVLLLSLLIAGCSKKDLVVPEPVQTVELEKAIDSQALKSAPSSNGFEVVPVDPRLKSNNTGVIRF